jgi:hypothetical protein
MKPTDTTHEDAQLQAEVQQAIRDNKEIIGLIDKSYAGVATPQDELRLKEMHKETDALLEQAKQEYGVGEQETSAAKWANRFVKAGEKVGEVLPTFRK